MEHAVILDYLPAGQLTIARLRLNRPAGLNALNHAMVRDLTRHLLHLRRQPQVVAVVLESALARAFCAGGDIIELRHTILAHPQGLNPDIQLFFTYEYRLDYLLHTFPKPVLAWGQGIIMGGGLGLFAAASHRVVTPTVQLAMPELLIGLYPDVGATWFLRRLPGRAGLLLALTGVSIGADDAHWLGLAEALLPLSARESVLAGLAGLPWRAGPGDHALLSAYLHQQMQRYEQRWGAGELWLQLPLLDEVLAGEDPLRWYAQLRQAEHTPLLAKARAHVDYGSPLSFAVTAALWQRSRHWSLAQALQRELAVTCNMTLQPDLPEGIRALLVDKDRQPRWQASELAAVPADQVAACIDPRWSLRQHPLRGLR
jgi:enoyl-CoA hydratase/carnithine racemase